MSASIQEHADKNSVYLQDLPAFPPVTARLMRLVAEEEFSYRDVADLIRSDPAFSAEILRLANSPVFGFRYEIKDIPHAIAVLGLNRLRAIVMTLAMKDFLISAKQQDVVRRCWRHSLATALTAEALARAFWIDGGIAYTAGLLHDIGLLALSASNPQPYAELVQHSFASVRSFLDAERELLGIDHCELGNWILAQWGLPEEFSRAAALHCLPPSESPTDYDHLISLSCRVAQLAGFTVYEHELSYDVGWIVAELPEQSRGRYRAQLEDLPMEIAIKVNSFDCDFLT